MNKPEHIINFNNIKLIDMHAHVRDMSSQGAAFSEIAYRRKAGIFSVYCCMEPSEWDFLTDLGCRPVSDAAMLSFGIHPWNSDRFDPDDHIEKYEAAPIIGEIGLDSVWTDVPYDVQLRVFTRQLQIAKTLKKPVVIHSKGCERKIADLLQDFDQPILMHWYSGDIPTLHSFIDLDCYFTLGPGLDKTDPALAAEMISKISRERLFAETDGLVSIFWIQDECPEYQLSPPDPDFAGNYAGIAAHKDYPLIFESLYDSLKYLADYDCVDIRSITGQNISNLIEFAFAHQNNNGKCLIITGGEPGPVPDASDFDLVIGADKGLQYALDAGLSPDIVIGDFDSLAKDLQIGLSRTRAISLPIRKNDSDLQSAAKYALEHGFRDISGCCAMGGRLDHMISNIQTASYVALKGGVCTLIGENDEICIFSGRKMTFPKREGWSLSVFAISDKCEGIDIAGALYTVSDFTLTNTLTRGLSNEWASDYIEVSVKSGILAVIMSRLH